MNGRKPLSAKVTGRPRMPVPRIDAIATKSIHRTENMLSKRSHILDKHYRIENSRPQFCKCVDRYPSRLFRLKQQVHLLWKTQLEIDATAYSFNGEPCPVCTGGCSQWTVARIGEQNWWENRTDLEERVRCRDFHTIGKFRWALGRIEK